MFLCGRGPHRVNHITKVSQLFSSIFFIINQFFNYYIYLHQKGIIVPRLLNPNTSYQNVWLHKANIQGFVKELMLGQFVVQVGAMEEDSKLRVEKFNNHNYQLWKMHVEVYLYQKELYLPLGGKEMNSNSMLDLEWQILDMKALGSIHLCLAMSVEFNISKETTTLGLMTTLDKICEKS